MIPASLEADGILVEIQRGAEAPVYSELRRRLWDDVLVEPVSAELRWHIARPGDSRRFPFERAFDLCHTLLDVQGVLNVEPNFRAGRDDKQESAAEGALLARVEEDPETSEKYAWHIEQVRAREARHQYSVTGNNVRVGHLDTGYTPHPELVMGTSVRADLGYNFEEGIDDPTEPLQTIDEGHGTATASVLLSLEGQQGTAAGSAYVEGVAPGAELVPIRVDRNVWFVSAVNDIRGIDHAIGKGCNVIAMSRGGPDSNALHDAVRLAVQRGVIVVAAASNCNLGCGVWSPGIYTEVVCVAGSTYRKTPWSKSSRGPSVAIGAPAYSVYRAKAVNNGGQYAFDVARSSGTSYATPIVAGAAALWIERHGGPRTLERKLGAMQRIPEAFKHLLTTAGYQPGDQWDSSQFGPGILDCVALLKAPLPTGNAGEFLGLPSRAISHRRSAAMALESLTPKSTDPRRKFLFSLEVEVAIWQQPRGAEFAESAVATVDLNRFGDVPVASVVKGRHTSTALSQLLGIQSKKRVPGARKTRR